MGRGRLLALFAAFDDEVLTTPTRPFSSPLSSPLNALLSPPRSPLFSLLSLFSIYSSHRYFANFFVDEARLNGRSFPTQDEEAAKLLYNYKPVGNSSYQAYLFPKQQ